jgi:hypothetical protein
VPGSGIRAAEQTAATGRWEEHYVIGTTGHSGRISAIWSKQKRRESRKEAGLVLKLKRERKEGNWEGIYSCIDKDRPLERFRTSRLAFGGLTISRD